MGDPVPSTGLVRILRRMVDAHGLAPVLHALAEVSEDLVYVSTPEIIAVADSVDAEDNWRDRESA